MSESILDMERPHTMTEAELTLEAWRASGDKKSWPTRLAGHVATLTVEVAALRAERDALEKWALSVVARRPANNQAWYIVHNELRAILETPTGTLRAMERDAVASMLLSVQQDCVALRGALRDAADALLSCRGALEPYHGANAFRDAGEAIKAARAALEGEQG